MPKGALSQTKGRWEQDKFISFTSKKLREVLRLKCNAKKSLGYHSYSDDTCCDKVTKKYRMGGQKLTSRWCAAVP